MNDVIERIIRIAARAPSAHNTQPWRVERVRDGIDLGLHDERLLKAGDPTGRDALLGLGCWVEAAAIAAREAGVGLDIRSDDGLAAFSADPTTAPRSPLIRLRLAAGGEPAIDPAAVPDDSDQHVPFTSYDVQGRSVHRGRLAPIAGDAGMGAALGEPWLRLVRVPGKRAPRLVALGDAGTLGRRAVTEEAVDWIRFTPSDPRFDRDGLTGPTLMLPAAAAALAGALTRSGAGRAVLENALTLEARAAPVAAILNRSHPGLFVLVADGRRFGAHGVAGSAAHPTGLPADRMIAAGRAQMRAWLVAHRAGVAVAPASQVIDAPRAHAALRRGLGLRVADVALAVFAAGVPSGTPPRSPRLPVHGST
ncbi:nitroreductase family protein [Microbacterium halotolerans]|uniref:nitroreductase family protein n=1 Tax=Microbacterium halotolerans TaxID=246613 RepID=UPI000E6AC7FA|nr:hypothetical protein [Microbacterium halotolerans]